MGPDFLYIGCQKAGSRWLYDQLSAHDGFWMPHKEFHYFDGYEAGREIRGGIAYEARQAELKAAKERGLLKGLSARKGSRSKPGVTETFRDQIRAGDGGNLDLDWYASLFRMKENRLSGDITPDYSALSPAMISLVTSRFPDLKCILFVRDPVARAWSHACQAWRTRHGEGAAPQDWSDLAAFLTTERVVALSYPSRIFTKWREYVPADRIFVGFFDELASRPEVLRADVLRFLGAGPAPQRIQPDFDRKRERNRVPCSPDVQRRLAEWFADELGACATVFGGPATQWSALHGSPAARRRENSSP